MSAFSAIVRRHPGLWRLTTRLKRLIMPHEPEMVLLPHLIARDRIAVDVGANMGKYTCAFAEFAHGVVAFEPNPGMARDLQRLLGPQVRVFAAAVSDQTGEAELRIPSSGSGRATIESANDLAGSIYETIMAPMVRLDDCELGDVGFLKVDVEGHELAVLRGGEQMLRRCKPVILIESEDQHRPDAVRTVKDFLGALGYSGWFLKGRVLTPVTRISSDERVFNYVFLAA